MSTPDSAPPEIITPGELERERLATWLDNEALFEEEWRNRRHAMGVVHVGISANLRRIADIIRSSKGDTT